MLHDDGGALVAPLHCSRQAGQRRVHTGHATLQEYVNGQLKTRYGDCFIRGNNGAPCLIGEWAWGGGGVAAAALA